MTISRRTALGSLFGLGIVAATGFTAALEAEAATIYAIAHCRYSVNVRSGPGTRYAKVGSIRKGTTFTGQRSGSWVRIASGSFTGRWVAAAYVEPAISSHNYVSTITPVVGGVTIRSGWNGTRVYLIRKHFGIDAPSSAGGTYDSLTQSKIVTFQRQKGLPVTGNVDRTTWDALNTGYAFDVDAYQVQPQLPLSATTTERREKMIQYALAQRGSRYCWGGAGPYNLGFDCSGLVLQSLYAAGRDPQPINVIKHAEPTYRTSRELYASTKMLSVPASQRRRGDLIFYMNSSNAVVHVTIDLGNGTMMEAYSATAGIRTIVKSYGSVHMAPYVKRPFWLKEIFGD